MPYPKNVETALAVEQVIRDNGAVPAYHRHHEWQMPCGIIKEQVEFLGKKNVWKVSLRDMPYVISRGLFGATTVAATMRIASMAGIKYLSLVALACVPGAETSMDISADLTEMENTSIAVVSTGCKINFGYRVNA